MMNAPRIHEIPANDSPLAYDEDKLVTVITNIYKHLIEVAYFPENGVLFPPQDTGRHTLDVEYLRDELHMNARVISLLKRLPYVSRKDYPECEWYPHAHVVNYLSREDALRARDPAHISVRGGGNEENIPNVDFMRPGDVSLSLPANPSDYMFTLILDTAANSIREPDLYYELPDCVDRAKIEVPEYENHYRNQPAYHALTFLRDYYFRLRSLEYVPFAKGTYYISGPNEVSSSISANIMRRYYGWPDNFRRDAWREVADRVNDEAEEAGYRFEDFLLSRQNRDESYDTEPAIEKATTEIAAKFGLRTTSEA